MKRWGRYERKNGKSNRKEKRNVSQLVNAMERFVLLSKEDKCLMGRNGRVKVECEFDRKMVTNSYMNTIQSILQDK